MSSISELLRYQIESAAWANARILKAVSEFNPEELERDFGTSERCIRGTLAHVCRAERTWFARIQGRAVEHHVPGDDEMAYLTDAWPRLSEQWLEWARALNDSSAAADLIYRDLRNKTWTQALWKVLLHVVNHSTHHRGQVSGFIRALGHIPPNVDSITFAREQTLS